MRLGGQTVAFVTVTEDLNDRDEYNNPKLVRTSVPVRGCRFRPLTAKEEVDAASVSVGEQVTDPWRCTAPPVPAVLNATSRDEVVVDGVTYKIMGGPRVFPGPLGRPFKVTIICQRKDG